MDFFPHQNWNLEQSPFLLLITAKKVAMPEIQTESNGGPVDKYHLVKLSVDTDRAKIYFTLDGYTPDLHKFGLRVRLW